MKEEGNKNIFDLTKFNYGKQHEDLLAKLHLPTPSSVRRGRNVTAGYTRSWGLEFGELGKAISNDPIYKESLKIARKLTLVAEHKLMNIFLIMKYGMQGLEGDIVEFGSYRGGSAIFMANVARRLGMTGTIYALDTFEGMPTTDTLLDLHSTGDFSDASFEALENKIKELNLKNIIPIKGLFEESFPNNLHRINKVTLAHIDCDIYGAVKYAISNVISKMNPSGGYLIFDDPLQGSCLGALEATEDMIEELGLRAEQAYPHLVYRMPKLAI